MNVLQQLLCIVLDTCVYWGTFLYFWWWQQPISKLEVFGEQYLPRCHMYMLAKTLHLWDEPHYRAPSFAEDLRDNLKNVAIPGTGIPLSVFCYSKYTALLFILLVNPAITLIAAVYCTLSSWWQQTRQPASTQDSTTTTPSSSSTSQQANGAAKYRQLLLFPNHWFAIWRHNCMLVGYHALVTGSSSSSQYAMEAKGTFLLQGQRLGLPVSPFYSEGTVFVKHTRIEGGMGIHVFKNFAQGGEWVIQRALNNSKELSRMLPPGAPLSTLRVVTASTAWLDKSAISRPASGAAGWIQQQQQQQGVNGRVSNGGQWPLKRMHSSSSGSGGSQGPGRVTPDLPLSAGVVQQQDGGPDLQPLLLNKDAAGGSNSSSSGRHPAPAAGDGGGSSDSGGAVGLSSSEQQLFDGRVHVVTAVWRAGLAGKDTDHSSICFPMDPQTGVLSQGVSANHWYKLGWRWCGRVDGATAGCTWLHHPDSKVPVAGATTPDVQQVMKTVMHAHLVATPDVPLVGWDVALTPEGVYLLEMNLSCNLFNGAFDSEGFYRSIFQHFQALEGLQEERCSGYSHCG